MQRVQAVLQGFTLFLAEPWWEVGGLRMKTLIGTNSPHDLGTSYLPFSVFPSM